MISVERYIAQWKRIEDLGIDPSEYVQIIFEIGTKAIQWGKNNWFSTNGIRISRHP